MTITQGSHQAVTFDITSYLWPDILVHNMTITHKDHIKLWPLTHLTFDLTYTTCSLHIKITLSCDLWHDMSPLTIDMVTITQEQNELFLYVNLVQDDYTKAWNDTILPHNSHLFKALFCNTITTWFRSNYNFWVIYWSLCLIGVLQCIFKLFEFIKFETQLLNSSEMRYKTVLFTGFSNVLIFKQTWLSLSSFHIFFLFWGSLLNSVAMHDGIKNLAIQVCVTILFCFSSVLTSIHRWVTDESRMLIILLK